MPIAKNTECSMDAVGFTVDYPQKGKITGITSMAGVLRKAVRDLLKRPLGSDFLRW